MANRCLVLTELFLPTKGGTAVWFDEVYRRLGGKEIHIVTAEVEGGGDHDRAHPNCVHRIGLRRVSWLRPESLGMYLKFFGASLWLLLKHRIDTIHAGRALPEGLIALVMGRLSRRPVMIYAHGEELTGWGRGNKYKAMSFALRHADKVVANSTFTRDTLIGLGVDVDRIEMINPGVDIQRFRPGLPFQDLRDSLGLATGARLLLSVGRLSRRKGFDTVIRCLPDLVAEGSDVHLAIIGIGEDRSYLEALASECGVSKRVHLLGHVAAEDLPRWYNACELFVLANREVAGDTEGFGMVFIEAAACGKAAVAGLAGGTGSAVLDGVTGVRIDGEDRNALANAIRGLLADDARRTALGEAGYERVREWLSWEAVADRTTSVMHALMR